MMRALLLCFGVVVFVAATGFGGEIASEALETKPGLPFWGIGLSNFHAEKPRPIAVPRAAHFIEYHWYWTFKFRVETNLDMLSQELDARLKDDKNRIEDTDEINTLQHYKDMIDQTLAGINRMRLYAAVHTDTGEILSDLSNRPIRNLVERKVGRKLYTLREISALELDKVPRTKDPELGYGKWVYGVAIFPNLPRVTRQFEVRLLGMGKRFVPTYEPGQLFYPVETIETDDMLNPSLRRGIRYTYRRIGQSGAPQLDPIRPEGEKMDWVWMWAPQVFPGKPRPLTIERPTKDPETGQSLKREYRYVPYRIWNNTNDPQPLVVKKSGLVYDIRWQGQPIRARMYDLGLPQDFWKTQVERGIRARVQSGAELEFVQGNEILDVAQGMEYIKSLYAKQQSTAPARAGQPVPYVPPYLSDPGLFRGEEAKATMTEQRGQLEDALENNPKRQAALQAIQEEAAADAKRKADILPLLEHRIGKERMVQKPIPPGKYGKGLMILRWGVTDIQGTVDRIVSDLKAAAITGVQPAGENSLLQRYLTLRAEHAKSMREGTDFADVPWAEPPEPSDEAVVKMLLTLAEEEVAAKGLEIDPETRRFYGELAPIGVVLNALCAEKEAKMAEGVPGDPAHPGGLIDTFFTVEWDGVLDQASFVSSYLRTLPEEREPTPRRDAPATIGMPGGPTAPGAPGGTDAPGDGGGADEPEIIW